MEVLEAKRIIEALADGRDPDTGSRVPATSPVDRPEIIRALHVALRHMEKAVRREKRLSRRAAATINQKKEDSALPGNAGRSWSHVDDERLSTLFDQGLSIFQMASEFDRTDGAIIARLVRTGKVPDSETARLRK